MSEFSEIVVRPRTGYAAAFMKVKFLKSGKQPKDYPFPYRPEVAVVGRSNAGKSSFINALLGQRIAKVSATPGKTRLLNFFDVEDAIYLVDMPGYGFATGDRQEVGSWRTMIETYLRERETLRGVLLIMDIRREWQEEEEMLKEWFSHHDIEWAVVLNKTDKLSRSAMLQKKKTLEKLLKTPVYTLSAAKKTGFDDIRNLVLKEWKK